MATVREMGDGWEACRKSPNRDYATCKNAADYREQALIRGKDKR
jgi:hypothetical protein